MAGTKRRHSGHSSKRARDEVHLEQLVTVAEPAFRAVLRLYERAFSEGEKESLASINAALSGWPGSNDRYHVVAARDARGRIVGGAFFHYVAAINAGFLGYLFVRPASREHGIGRRLLRSVDATLRQDAKRLHRPTPAGLFFELKKPRGADSRSELRFWRALGVVLLDLDWQYPRLRRDAAPLDMWLALRPRQRPPVVISRRFIRRATLAIQRSVYHRGPESPMVRRVLGSMRGTIAPWPD